MPASPEELKIAYQANNIKVTDMCPHGCTDYCIGGMTLAESINGDIDIIVPEQASTCPNGVVLNMLAQEALKLQNSRRARP